MSAPTTRRAALAALAGSLAFAGTIGAAIGEAATVDPDAELFRQFARRQAAMARCYGGELDAIADPTEQDRANSVLLDEASAAETAMLRLGAKTPRGAALLLWVAIPHMHGERWADEAISLGNFGEVHKDESSLDFPERLVLAAIRAMEA